MSTQTMAEAPRQNKTGSENDLTQIDQIFENLQANRQAMANTNWAARVARLKKIHDWVNSHEDDIIAAGYADFRKPASEVRLTEVYAVLSEARHAIRHLKKWMKPKRVWPTLALATTRGKIIYEPKGVALVIAPWNYPFCLSIGPLISSIAAGCVTCIKPSEMTPAMSAVIRRMVADLFPENEVAVFEGEVDVATALLDKPFHHIFFTGSPQVGKIVMKAASNHLATVTLELGGKSPTIIDESADLADAAAKIAWGKFINNGQTCIAPDYLLIHETRFEAFRDLLAKCIRASYGETSEQRESSPDYARIVNANHFQRLKHLLDETLAMGAELVQGGASNAETQYLEPTLLANVDPASPAMTEEIFGPILPMIPYRDLNEALAIINAKHKPLALYIFSTSKQTIDRILSNTSAGGSCINEVAAHFLHANLPFGGINNSGIGNAHGEYGFKAFSHERAVLSHHRFSALKLMAPPYGKRAKRLIDLTLKYF